MPPEIKINHDPMQVFCEKCGQVYHWGNAHHCEGYMRQRIEKLEEQVAQLMSREKLAEPTIAVESDWSKQHHGKTACQCGGQCGGGDLDFKNEIEALKEKYQAQITAALSVLPAAQPLQTDPRSIACACHHDKVYSQIVMTSFPPQYAWICRSCGIKGVDRIDYDTAESYEMVEARFAEQTKE